MIRRLRGRFIRIATCSVAAVMLLLTVILNTANFLSTDADLRSTLELIQKNEGTIPGAGASTPPSGEEQKAPPDAPRGPFTPETPFSTRFFVLRLQPDGTLLDAKLDQIASVTEDETQQYAAAAAAHGAGCGYYGTYRFLVTQTGDGQLTAIFLYAYQQLRAVRTVLLWSLTAAVSCTLLVLLLVVLLSRKAIDPVVRSAEQQKQFITDASHELKTPITVIATSLRVLEMETGPQKWIDKARAQTEKLTSLVSSLVTLSRMDEEKPPIRREPFDLSGAVQETAESFADLAESAAHALRLSIAPGLQLRGDEAAVRQLVSILLDNAVKYALPGSAISLRLSPARRGVQLQCENAAAPLERAQLDRLFDRFYRADPARGGSGGFGIGLSIARSIALAHRGSIRADFDPPNIRFTAVLRNIH